jgi:DNA/RNA-binding domain of Phe-tRNA-synthetase-like protein
MPSMRIAVDPAIWPCFPGMVIVAVAGRGIENHGPNEAVDQSWRRAWEYLPAALAGCPNPQSHPGIGAWRDAFKQLGVSGKAFPSSVEALARRALKGGEPIRINPLVDITNATALRHLVPTGGFDVKGVTEDLSVRLTAEGETFQALDDEAPQPVAPGEVAYACGPVLLTRHLCWRQARQLLMTPESRDVLLVSEVLPAAGTSTPQSVREAFEEAVRMLGGEPNGTILTESSPSAKL